MTERLKPSKYNFVFKLDNGSHMAYNTVSGAFVSISDDNYEVVTHLLENPNQYISKNGDEDKLVESAKRARFIIKEDIDELQNIIFLTNLMKYSTDVFQLTIMPTLDCNYKCPYCYENPEKGNMTSDAQRGLSLWVDKKLVSTKYLSVGWFGGEPLMAIKVMRNLTKKFKQSCEKYHVEYSSSITTNGYFINNKFISEIKDLSINNVQVTLDGPPDCHDKRRILKNNRGTFNRIIKNLMNMCEKNEDVLITMRVNYDVESYDRIPELFQYIPEIVKQRSRIYFRQTFPPPTWWDAIEPVKKSNIPKSSKQLDSIRLLRLAQDNGFKVFITNISPVAGYCEADYVNSFVVDPNCTLHKCTVAFDEKHKIGNITHEGKEIIDVQMLSQWMLRDTYSKSICKDCKILPVCMGGCGFNDLCSTGKARCGIVNEKDKTIEMLKLLYRNIIIENNEKTKTKKQ